MTTKIKLIADDAINATHLDSSASPQFTNLTLTGNLTVQGTTTTLDTTNLNVEDKNITLNYGTGDTSSNAGGAGITIQDAVDSSNDATILWDASDDEFDFSHAINIPNLKVSGAQGTDGQLLTSTGSGIAWEDAPASGPTHKTFGTSSIMIGDSTTGTINAADYNTGLGVDVFANLTSGDQNTVLGFEAGNALTTHSKNTLIGYQAGKLLGGSSGSSLAQRNVFIGYGAGLNVDEGQRAIAIGYYAMHSSLGSTTNDIAIGYNAMQYRQSTSGDSIAIGDNAHRGDINEGYQNANRNVAIGSNALSVVETGGQQNTVVGWWAGKNVTTGPNNTLIGSEAGQAVSTGQINTLLGYRAGELITTGNYNVILGSYDGNEGGLDIRTSSNNIVLSDGSGNIRMRINGSGNVGIGTSSPAFENGNGLEIRNSSGNGAHLKLTDNASGTGATQGFDLYMFNNQGYIENYENAPTVFRNNGSEVMRIDSKGALGLGTTPPSGTHTTWSQLFTGTKASIISENTSGAGGLDGTWLTDNLYIKQSTGSFANITTNESSAILQEGGVIKFFSQGSGSADAAVTVSEKMRIDSSGKVSIGTTSATELLNIAAGSSDGAGIEMAGNGTTVGSTSLFVGHGSTNNGYVYQRANSPLIFGTNNIERMRIDSAGTMFHRTATPTLHSATTGIVFENGSLLTDVTRGAGKSINLAQNAAVDSGNTWAYLATDEASLYQQFGGKHYFYTAPSGSAGADITFGNKMLIDNDYVVPKMNFHYAENTIYAVNTTGNEHTSSNGVLILKQQISVSAGSKIIVWYDTGQILNNNQGGNGSSASNPQIAIYVSSNASAPSRGAANQINGNTDHYLYPAGNIGSARVKMNGMGATGTISTAGTYYIYMYGGSYNSGQYTFNYQNSSGATGNRGSSIIWTEIMA